MRLAFERADGRNTGVGTQVRLFGRQIIRRPAAIVLRSEF